MQRHPAPRQNNTNAVTEAITAAPCVASGSPIQSEWPDKVATTRKNPMQRVLTDSTIPTRCCHFLFQGDRDTANDSATNVIAVWGCMGTYSGVIRSSQPILIHHPNRMSNE